MAFLAHLYAWRVYNNTISIYSISTGRGEGSSVRFPFRASPSELSVLPLSSADACRSAGLGLTYLISVIRSACYDEELGTPPPHPDYSLPSSILRTPIAPTASKRDRVEDSTTPLSKRRRTSKTVTISILKSGGSVVVETEGFVGKGVSSRRRSE